MLVQGLKTKLLRAVKHEGVKKTGEKYLFYSASFLDEGANVIKMNFSNQLSENKKVAEKYENSKEIPVTIDFQIYQSGFNLRATVVDIAG